MHFALGKIIGGGFPLAALGASTEIMAHFDKAVVGGGEVADAAWYALGKSSRCSCGDPTVFHIYFTDVDPFGYRTAKHCDPKINEIWNRSLRTQGVFKSPGKLYPSLALKTVGLELTSLAFKHRANALSECGTGRT